MFQTRLTTGRAELQPKTIARDYGFGLDTGTGSVTIGGTSLTSRQLESRI